MPESATSFDIIPVNQVEALIWALGIILCISCAVHYVKMNGSVDVDRTIWNAQCAFDANHDESNHDEKWLSSQHETCFKNLKWHFGSASLMFECV